MNYISIHNNQAISVSSIPVLDYEVFFEFNTSLISSGTANHCVQYFGCLDGDRIKLYCCIADDDNHDIRVSSCHVLAGTTLKSMTAKQFCFEKFEREIHENFGILFSDHPWLKPLRYAHDRANKAATIANYPFFEIESEQLHEVGVGPIHAGVIEPGHFRFLCNGEQILHLEIQLGYQHRGIEQLFLEKKKLLQRVTLAESIAGDTVVGHTTAFSQLWESLCGFQPTRDIELARTVALELERIAIHTGDLSALCGDIAYQLGASVFGRLRTPIINFMQEWCGNRLAKGMIRPGRNAWPLNKDLVSRLTEVLDTFEPDFDEMNKELSSLPSALSRFERTGVMSPENILSIGAVGMSARMCGLNRDIRLSHPNGLYPETGHEPVIKHHGDVYSRVQIRKQEVTQSIQYIRKLITLPIPHSPHPPLPLLQARPNTFALSLTEGWRGEICHTAITDANGDLLIYKIKDPSFHNWLVLALAVRNNEISDFPVNNKSFNLSYCGHDL